MLNIDLSECNEYEYRFYSNIYNLIINSCIQSPNLKNDVIEFVNINNIEYYNYIDLLIIVLQKIQECNPVFNYNIEINYEICKVCGNTNSKSPYINLIEYDDIPYKDGIVDVNSILNSILNINQCAFCGLKVDTYLDLGKYVIFNTMPTNNMPSNFMHNGYLFNKIVNVNLTQLECFRIDGSIHSFVFGVESGFNNATQVIYERNLKYIQPFGILNEASLCSVIAGIQNVLTLNVFNNKFVKHITDKDVYYFKPDSVYSKTLRPDAIRVKVAKLCEDNKWINTTSTSVYPVFISYTIPIIQYLLAVFIYSFNNYGYDYKYGKNILQNIIHELYNYNEFPYIKSTFIDNVKEIEKKGIYKYIYKECRKLSKDRIPEPCTIFQDGRLYALICMFIPTKGAGHYYTIARRTNDNITKWYILDDNKSHIECNIYEILIELATLNETVYYIYERR
jgi:hypothetical protein